MVLDRSLSILDWPLLKSSSIIVESKSIWNKLTPVSSPSKIIQNKGTDFLKLRLKCLTSSNYNTFCLPIHLSILKDSVLANIWCIALWHSRLDSYETTWIFCIRRVSQMFAKQDKWFVWKMGTRFKLLCIQY